MAVATKGTVLPANQREGYGAVPGIAPPNVPFPQATHPVYEAGPEWTKLELTSEQQVLSQEPLKANGFLAGIWVRLETETAGEAGSGALRKDAPFNYLRRLEFQDQGGKPLSSLTGFNWFMADLFGGVLGNPNLPSLPSFKNEVTKSACTYYIPLQISPTGFGALTNLTEATKFQLQPTLATESEVYSTNPTKVPKVKLKTWLELWPLAEAQTKPEPGFPQGRPQEQRPPLEGTIMAHTEVANIKAEEGENSPTFSRVGQMVRAQIIISRATGANGIREDGLLPNPLQYIWSRNQFRSIDPTLMRDITLSKLPNVEGLVSNAYAVGVCPLPYNEGTGRLLGDNNLNSLLATTNATKMELKGTFKKSILEFITQDVAIMATSETGRRETPGWAATEPRGVE